MEDANKLVAAEYVWWSEEAKDSGWVAGEI